VANNDRRQTHDGVTDHRHDDARLTTIAQSIHARRDRLRRRRIPKLSAQRRDDRRVAFVGVTNQYVRHLSIA